jgi:hypothetical protein
MSRDVFFDRTGVLAFLSMMSKDPRQAHRDDLSGSDDIAQSVPEDLDTRWRSRGFISATTRRA